MSYILHTVADVVPPEIVLWRADGACGVRVQVVDHAVKNEAGEEVTPRGPVLSVALASLQTALGEVLPTANVEQLNQKQANRWLRDVGTPDDWVNLVLAN